ncbi:acetylcholinesterase-1 isoform X2 [Rhipicephalus microplus]|uniref:acetylcholinesterase-1 isoform X2 n=1 Tax=Rhipicephalus microplus TaxID=6941 RepID=UPI003F6C67E4
MDAEVESFELSSSLASLDPDVSQSDDGNPRSIPKWVLYVPMVASAVFLFVFIATKRTAGFHDGASVSLAAHRSVVIQPVLEEIPHVEVHLTDRVYSGRVISVGNRKLHAFFGIPYAEPPLGSLRFRKPVPLKPQRTKRDPLGPLMMVRQKRFPCPQNQPWNPPRAHSLDVNISEDCLHLNVWAPADSSRVRAVILFIHGGDFQRGGNDEAINDGTLLSAEGDVVVVVPNYRLNAFGFLNGHVANAPGNVGLHDVILALRWVYKNIARFGGNPDNITLAGRDAGAVLAGYVMISPLTQGLVRRYILLGGSPFWSLPDNRGTRSVDNIKLLASRLNCDHGEDVFDAIQCLSKLDLYEYVDLEDLSQFAMYPSDQDDALPFAIPAGLGSVPYGAEDVLLGNELFVGESLVAPFLTMPLSGVLNRSLRSFGSKFLRKFGFDDGAEAMKRYDIYSATNRTVAFADMVGDFVVRCPLQFLADELARRGRRVFYYVLKSEPAWLEHTDPAFDQSLLFGLPLVEHSAPRDLVALTKNVIYSWTTFAKTGNLRLFNKMPWPPYSSSRRTFVVLGQGREEISSAYRQNFCDQWRSRIVGG